MSTTKSTIVDTVRVACVGAAGQVLPLGHADVTHCRVSVITATGEQWLGRKAFTSGPEAIRAAEKILARAGKPSTWDRDVLAAYYDRA